jgi:6-phosphogluconolactonase
MMASLLGAACGGGGGGGTGGDGGGGGDGGDGGGGDGRTPGPLVAYVGGYSSQIAVYSVDADTLAFTPLAPATSGAGPSFLSIDPQHRWLLAVNESNDTVQSFTIAADGTLTSIGMRPSGGEGPAHVALDATGTWALVANYTSGGVESLPVASNGSLGAPADTIAPGVKSHQVVATASGTLYVPCLGSDHIAILDLDASGMLNARTPAPAPAGAGPRHLALRADGAIAWVVNELASSVTTYAVGGDGSLTRGATVSTLPANVTVQNTGAEIAIDPTGRWVLASNRGHNSIAVFAVASDGSLSLLGTTPTGGSTPRHFSFVPGGRAIVVANQDSGTVTGLRFDPTTGALTPIGQLTTATLPTFVQVIER